MEKKIDKKNISNGFTLVELLIVLGIMSVVSAVGFVSYQSSRDEASLRAAQREVVAAIRMTQGLALQGKTQNMGATLGERTPCGYGVEFMDNHSYRIFYSYKNDLTGNPKKTCANDAAYPNDLKVAVIGGSGQNFDLKNNNITITNSPIASTRIYYTIPFGGIVGGSKAINFTTGSGDTKSISINTTGNVTESD